MLASTCLYSLYVCLVFVFSSFYSPRKDAKVTAVLSWPHKHTRKNFNVRCFRACPRFAALSTGRHLYSAGRPSRWASAHILVCVCSLAGGTDVMYNKFNISSSSPPDSESVYSCAVAMTSGQWRISRCHDRHLVVCQSDHLLPGILH